MKKVLVVGVTVVILVIAVVVLNRELPQVKEQAAASDSKAEPGTDQATSIAVNDLVLKSLDGKNVKLSDYRGKVVLIDFWGTWCDPCKIETPWLIEFQQKYGPRGFTVLGVATDSDGAKVVAPYVEQSRFDVDGQQEAMNYPIFLGDDALTDKFGITAYPTGILIGRDGHLVKITVGLVSKDELEKDIQSQL
jgi:thiol-disulfide isomerase/thioredoxin